MCTYQCQHCLPPYQGILMGVLRKCFLTQLSCNIIYFVSVVSILGKILTVTSHGWVVILDNKMSLSQIHWHAHGCPLKPQIDKCINHMTGKW